MQGKRRKLPGELKAKAALEALAGDKTINEIASKYEVHPNQVSTWKKAAPGGGHRFLRRPPRPQAGRGR